MRVISTAMHAGLDYLVGVLLIIAPWLFSFADGSSRAKTISIVAGIVLIGMSMVTDYEGGFLRRLIPMKTHLLADAILGVILIASPWVFGFADRGVNAWLPFVAIGLGEVGASAMTRTVPRDAGLRHRGQRTA